MDRPLKETVYTPDSELLHFGRLLRSMREYFKASGLSADATHHPVTTTKLGGGQLARTSVR